MRDAAAVLAVLEVVGEVACVVAAMMAAIVTASGQAEGVERVGELGVLGRAGGVDDLAEGAGLRRRRLRD